MTEVEKPIELDEPAKTPQEKVLDKVTETGDAVSKLQNTIAQTKVVTSDIKKLVSEIAEKAPDLVSCITNVKDFVMSSLVGSPINEKTCDEMLKQLKEVECKVNDQKVKVGNQSIAEVASDQAKKLQKAWETIKEACELEKEATVIIKEIDDQIKVMEGMAEEIEKLLRNYNGKFANDEVNKKKIMARIKAVQIKLRTNYIETRDKIASLKIKIGDKIVDLNFVDRQQTDLILQNIAVGAVSVVQAFMAKGTQSIADCVGNVTGSFTRIGENISTKVKISEVRSRLEGLMKEINKLEIRLAKIEKIKIEAEKFLAENDDE